MADTLCCFYSSLSINIITFFFHHGKQIFFVVEAARISWSNLNTVSFPAVCGWGGFKIIKIKKRQLIPDNYIPWSDFPQDLLSLSLSFLLVPLTFFPCGLMAAPALPVDSAPCAEQPAPAAAAEQTPNSTVPRSQPLTPPCIPLPSRAGLARQSAKNREWGDARENTRAVQTHTEA